MYSWIWRNLPGGLPGRIIGSLAMVIGIAALLWFVVFPWVEPLLPFGDPGAVDTSAPAPQ